MSSHLPDTGKTAAAAPLLTLRKVIGLRQLFSLAFGTIIGVGWITVLGEWLTLAGSLGAVLAFTAGGLVMLAIGLSYAEMASMFPVSGGEVAYSYEVYGLRTASLTGWLLALSYIGLVIFEGISVGWIASALFPILEGPALYRFLGSEVELGSLLVGLMGTAVITTFNYRGAQLAATFQEILVFLLLAISSVFIAAGFVGGELANLKPLFTESPSGWIGGGILAIFATSPFWYSGFDTIPQAMGEKSEQAPLHLVGRVIMLSILVAAVFYAAVILATSMVLPQKLLVTLELPTARAFQNAFDSVLLGKAVLLAGLLGLVSTWNAFFFSGSRVLFALGRSRILPAFFGRIHPRHRTPFGAILFVGVLGAAGTLLGRSAILPIVNAGGTCLGVVFLLTCIGVLRLRASQPDRPRPYRLRSRLIPILGTAGSAAMLMLSIYQPYASASSSLPLEWTFFLVWTLMGALFWLAAGRLRHTIDEPERRRILTGNEREIESR